MPSFLRWILALAPLNPIALRIVQGGSRRPRHFYIRAGYLALLIVVLLWSLLMSTTGESLSYRELAAAGASSFTAIAYLQIILICLLAPIFFAGAIAQESSPRTWEILLTTPLTPVQVVLGNLLGRLFFIFALLLAAVPLFALTQYFGGVPGSSILISALISACAALTVGSVAIALSVSRLVGKRAVFTFYIGVVSFLAVTFAADRWLVSTGQVAPGGGVTWMTALNPFLTLRSLLNPSTYGPAPRGTLTGLGSWMLERPVLTFCAGSAALSLILSIGSTLLVRAGGLAATRREHGKGAGAMIRRALKLRGGGASRAARAVWHNPIAWREAAARNATLGRVMARWLFIVIGAAWGVAIVWAYHTSVVTPAEFRLLLLTTLNMEFAVATLVAINMSATAISREREDGTLDILLTTPITPGAYLSGKLRGLVAYLIPLLLVPIGTLAMACAYVFLGGFGGAQGVTVQEVGANGAITVPLVLPEGALLLPLVLIPFIAFTAVVGLNWSLRSRGTISSVVATFAVLGVIGGLVSVCGWKSAVDLPFVGPALAALSPSPLMLAIIEPVSTMRETVMRSPDDGLRSARTALILGAILGAVAISALVYVIHAAMTRTFDATMRRFAGVK